MSIVIALLLLTLLLLLLIASIGLCWYIANRLLHRPRKAPALNIPVIATDEKSITLKRTANTKHPGIFGVTGADGQAIIGSLLSDDTDNTETITRKIIYATGTLTNAVAWNTTVYGRALRDSLELTIKDVLVPGALGDMPAWFVPGDRNTWAILVHGATGTRDQGLRSFKTLAGLGMNILAITYRNDGEAPASPDGHSHLGDSEWQDLEAAVKYALAQGAQHIILYGWSLGGTIVKTFLGRSAYTNHIRAAVLDSPILNWHATITTLIKKNSLPSLLAKGTEAIVSMRTGVHLRALDNLDQTRSQLPILLFHGIDDTTAPIAISDAFAATHTNVTYHRFPDAEHTQCWNANSSTYETALRTFLSQALAESETAHNV